VEHNRLRTFRLDPVTVQVLEVKLGGNSLLIRSFDGG
jgi:hypothetical protein